ncbi:MAG: DNA alkylation repair protein [Candidatus Kerfeldbacteria bacterium]|nr:DNA alkylation repair protein [Candidatus Kerfeldbacteria bacterium]
MSTINDLKRDFRRLASPKKAKASAWFFKTAKGEYGHGDKFLGVTVPEQRQIAKKHRDLPLADVRRLLQSKYHEHRLTAVLILSDQFKRAGDKRRAQIAQSYLKSTKYINNWDIVDSSAPHILGTYLLDKPRAVLYKLARSKNLWERRIAVLATQTFIRHGQFKDTLKLASMLLRDKEDLMHKAVGWMLREVGDRDRAVEERFLKEYAPVMPRTMLRYAVEKWPAVSRKRFMLKRNRNP